jgi:hypothetical protein
MKLQIHLVRGTNLQAADFGGTSGKYSSIVIVTIRSLYCIRAWNATKEEQSCGQDGKSSLG